MYIMVCSTNVPTHNNSGLHKNDKILQILRLWKSALFATIDILDFVIFAQPRIEGIWSWKFACW
jgi:hypothetical protein